MEPQTAKRLLKILHYQKYLGIFLIVIGIPMIIFVHEQKASFPLMIGLFTLYTSLEKVEDERSMGLKTSSLYIAFILAYAVKLLTSSLFTYGLVPFHLVDIDHFIILVFAIAVLVYYPRLYSSRS